MQLELLEAIRDLLILDNRFIIGGILLIGITVYGYYKSDVKLK